MKTPLNLIAVSALAGLVSVGCESMQSLARNAAVPLPDPPPLPAWTKAKTPPAADDAKKVLITSKFVEITNPSGTRELPASRYEKRMEEREFGMFMRSMAQTKGADLLSTPSVVAREGQSAEIVVGREFKYPKDPEKPEELATELLGIANHVRARPTADGKRIRLDVAGQVKEFKGFYKTASGHERPVFETRRLGSTVNLANGETIVFGGVLSKEYQDVEDKVPFLGDLPLIGLLFRSRETVELDRELILAVTPKLIDPAGNPIAAR